jgi:hypothetical protein
MGLEAHRLDVKAPHSTWWWHAFGGIDDTLEDLTQPLHAKQLAWKHQNVTFWGLDITLGLGFDGDWRHLARFEGRGRGIMEKRLCLKTIGLWRPSAPFSNSKTWTKVSNVAQKKGDVRFLGFLLCANYELNNITFVKGQDKGCWLLILCFTLSIVDKHVWEHFV